MKNKFIKWFNKKFGWIMHPAHKQGKELRNTKYQ